MISKVCPVCFKEFVCRSNSRKYCSRECYEKTKTTRMNGDTNICTLCKIEKPRSEFGASKRASNSLLSWCKKCYKERTRSKYSFECVDCGEKYKRTYKPSKDNRCHKCAIAKIIKDNGGVTLNYTGTTNFAGGTYAQWKCSAKRRGYEWTITKEVVEKKFEDQKGVCALSGIKMEPRTKSPYRPSIDRIDSKKGYVEGNFQFICSMVNVMKNKFDEDNFIRMCGLIAKYRVKDRP